MNVKFEGVFRTIFLFPMSLSLVVTGTIWRWLLQPEGLNALPNRLFGLEPYTFNWLSSRKLVLNFDWGEAPMYLTYLGLFILAILAFNYFIKERWGTLTFVSAIGGILLFLYAVGFWENTIWPQLGATNRDGEFISMPEPKGYQVALSGIVIAAIWQMAGYTMAMFLAGIRGIPEELREAARVDGCSEFGVYWRVVLPQLTPVAISAVIVLGHISLKIFDLVFAMTGRQNFQTIVPGIMVYGAFDTNRYATASAIAVIMLVLVSVVIVPYLWTQLKNREA
jgi:glucose/mannose transport system permease protein